MKKIEKKMLDYYFVRKKYANENRGALICLKNGTFYVSRGRMGRYVIVSSHIDPWHSKIKLEARSRGFKTFFMLNVAQYEIFKCA